MRNGVGMASLISRSDLDHVMQRAGEDLRTLKGARLFITGGTGFVGKWLLETLIRANDVWELGLSAVVLSRNPGAFMKEAPWIATNKAITLLQGDISSFDYPEDTFTHVIHAATDVVAVNSPLSTFDATVGGTRRVLEFCRERKVRDVLLVSSGAVYGKQPLDVDFVSEDYLGAPISTDIRSAYGEGKRASEWLAAAYADAYGMSTKIARCFAFVGPYLALDKQFAVGNFIRDALQGKAISIGGDGTPLRSYLHAADLAVWLFAILVRGSTARPYNVGSDQSISIRFLAETVAQVAGVATTQISVAREPVAGMRPERYVPSISRAREELGLDVWLPLDEALARTIAWVRENSNRWSQ